MRLTARKERDTRVICGYLLLTVIANSANVFRYTFEARTMACGKSITCHVRSEVQKPLERRDPAVHPMIARQI